MVRRVVGPGATIALHDGEVSQQPIGANVQDESFDLMRLSDRVRYVDNDRNFDGVVLPVPDPVVPDSLP